MILYFGKNNVQFARTRTVSEHIVYESDDLLVASAIPYSSLQTRSGRTVYIWGDVYGARQRNGDIRVVDLLTGTSVLCDLFESLEDAEIPGRLEGNYIALLLDKKSNKATLLCDEFNRSEVFYSEREGGVIASSDMESQAQSIKTVEYSQAALANMLSVYGCFAPKKLTLYQGINRLGVGERLILQSKSVEVAKNRFSAAPCREYAEREHHEYAEILEESVRIRASDQMNWIFLSSGWDSTAILSLLVKEYGRSRVRGVIGKMNYSERAGTINQFELDRAEKFAEHFGIKLDVVPLDLCQQDAIDYWQAIGPLLKRQHIYAISSYNFYRLTDHVRQQGGSNDAIFAGEISDGIHNFGFSQFATFLDHPDLGFREYNDKMASYMYGPTFFKSVLNGNYAEDAVYKILRARLGSAKFDDLAGDHENDRRRKYFLSFFNRNVRLPFYALANTNILTHQGACMLEDSIHESYLKDACEQAAPETLYAWLLHLYNSFHWQGGTVRCFGARLAEAGQKIRFPFWDGRLHNFLSEMPENWGRGLELRPAKYPLKWALANKFDYPMHYQAGPHSYLYDVNPQFSHVGEMLFGSFVSSYFKEVLNGYPYEALLDPECFNLEYMRTVVNKYRDGVEFAGQERTDLMALVTLCLVGWY